MSDVPEKGSDQHIGAMIGYRAILNGVIVPQAKMTYTQELEKALAIQHGLRNFVGSRTTGTTRAAAALTFMLSTEYKTIVEAARLYLEQLR